MPYVVLIDDGRSDKNDCDTGAKFTISHDQIKLDCSDLYPLCFRLIQTVFSTLRLKKVIISQPQKLDPCRNATIVAKVYCIDISCFSEMINVI